MLPSSFPPASHLAAPHPPTRPKVGTDTQGAASCIVVHWAWACSHGFLPVLSIGDSWGMLACLCAVLWHLPAVPALNRTGDPGPGPSIQKTYDLTRYLEHQLRSLAGTYVSTRGNGKVWELGKGEKKLVGERQDGGGVPVGNSDQGGPLVPNGPHVWPIACPSLLGAPLLPIPGPRTRHVGRPRTRLGPLPHWLPAQPPASPWGLGKSLLFTPCCGVSCTGGAGWGWRGPTSHACVPARLCPRPGALLLWTHGPPFCLPLPS